MDQDYTKLVEFNKERYRQKFSQKDRRDNNIDNTYKFNQYSHSFFIGRVSSLEIKIGFSFQEPLEEWSIKLKFSPIKGEITIELV
jgi:hypothetical protein